MERHVHGKIQWHSHVQTHVYLHKKMPRNTFTQAHACLETSVAEQRPLTLMSVRVKKELAEKVRDHVRLPILEWSSLQIRG